MSFPRRSPRDTVGGIVLFGRILDKIRLNAEGKLPEGYHLGFIAGNRTFDDRVCRFLKVDFDALSARTLQGGSDEEILEWCFQTSGRPDEEQIEVWNTFMMQIFCLSLKIQRQSHQSGPIIPPPTQPSPASPGRVRVENLLSFPSTIPKSYP